MIKKLLVVGVGNPVLTDDAIGVRLATDLRDALAGVPALDIRPIEAAWGLDLLQVFAGHDEVVVLDALKAWDVPAGYWCHLTLAGLRHTRYVCHVHDLNLPTILELGRRMGLALPFDTHVHVFGVAVSDAARFGVSLTPPLAAAYPKLLAEIAHELRTMAAPVAVPA